jgi:hypothetical protein
VANKGRSSNCIYLEGKLEAVISTLGNIPLHNLREGYLDPKPIIAAVLELEALKKSLPEMV